MVVNLQVDVTLQVFLFKYSFLFLIYVEHAAWINQGACLHDMHSNDISGLHLYWYVTCLGMLAGTVACWHGLAHTYTSEPCWSSGLSVHIQTA